MYLKPADRLIEGIPLKVRDPDLGDHLPPEGRDVPESLYWHRRLMDGDVVRLKELTAVPAGEEWKPLPGEIDDPKAYAEAIKAGTITELSDPQADS